MKMKIKIKTIKRELGGVVATGFQTPQGLIGFLNLNQVSIEDKKLWDAIITHRMYSIFHGKPLSIPYALDCRICLSKRDQTHLEEDPYESDLRRKYPDLDERKFETPEISIRLYRSKNKWKAELTNPRP